MSERWKPEYKERFYYIKSNGEVATELRYDDAYDYEYYERGNCFRTRAEAEAAAVKIRELLLSLHEEQPVTECNQLPKLTTEVFDRPDCPEWAQYAVVDCDGYAWWYKGVPTRSVGGKWFCDDTYWKGTHGIWDSSDWQNSLIERPAKLPDWCKVGKWVYLSNAKYYKIEKVDSYGIILAGGIVIKTDDIHAEAVSARLRPYNAEEMQGLVGKSITFKDGAVCLCTAWSAPSKRIILDNTNWTAQSLLDAGCTSEGNPCGKLEHLNEKGEWVE